MIPTSLPTTEHAWKRLGEGELPHLEEFVFQATFDFRQIADSALLADFIPSDKSTGNLVDPSQFRGCVRTAWDENRPRFLVFHEPTFTEGQERYYAAIWLESPQSPLVKPSCVDGGVWQEGIMTNSTTPSADHAIANNRRQCGYKV